MSNLFPKENNEPSIEEQTVGLREANVQQFRAKNEQIKAINAIKPEPRDSLSLAAPQERPNPLEMRMSMAPASNHISGTDVANFLFGDEMGVMGMKMDAEGMHWEWEIAKDQWANQPLWVNLLATTSIVGSALFPALIAAPRASYKFGALGAKLGKFGDKALEVKKFQDLRLLDEAANLDNVSNATLKTLRMQENQLVSYNKLSALMEAEEKGELTISGFEKARFAFNKRFANLHFKTSASIVEGNSAKTAFHTSLDELNKAEDIGRMFTDMPGADSKIINYLYNKEAPDLFPKVNLTPKEKAYADYMGDMYRTHQDEALQEGLITKEIREHIGSMHIPAQVKGTPMPDVGITREFIDPVRGARKVTRPGVLVGKDVPTKGFKKLFGKSEHVVEEVGKTEYLALKTHNNFRLDFDTLSKQRKADLPEVARRLESGQLITDVAEVNVRGYMMDRMILNNFKATRDMAMNPSWSTPHLDMMGRFNPTGNLTHSQVSELALKAGFVSMDNVPSGAKDALVRMIKQKGGKLGPKDELPWMRQSAFDEIFGSEGAFNQLQSTSDMMEVITTMFKTAKTALSPTTHLQNGVGNFVLMAQAGMNPFSPKNLDIMIESGDAFKKIAAYHTAGRKAGMSSRELLDTAKVNLGHMTVNGKKFNLTDELLDPQVRDLIEESSFSNAEGAGRLDELLKSLKKEQRLTKATIKGYMKVKSVLQVGDRVKWADNATKAYLAEDMIPKISMYMKLRGDGLTKAAAAIEVGRRLPMYGTVGSSIRQGRKWAFPWATFPAEAMRITKNNMMDHPLRMMPWLHATNIMQSMIAGTGGAPTDPQEVEGLKRSLPTWAQKPNTVIGSGSATAGIGGGLTGALVGGTVGARGGVAGVLAGAAVGGAAGAMGLKAITSEEDAGGMRGLILDWLPHSSFMLASDSPDMMGDYAPWRGLQGMQEQLPAEPFAIFKPMLEIMAGKTGWGTDIPTAGTGDAFGKMISGYIGFIAPPIVQKYGFKTNTPDVSVSEAIFNTPLPGDITNVSRLMQDTGTAIDPQTGKPGSLSHDFLLKNFGLGKSWAATGAVALANETLTERHMGDIRKYLAKQLSFYAANDKEDRVMKILTDVMETYTKQFTNDPVQATRAYQKWVEGKLSILGQLPKLSGWSEDEMKMRLSKSFDLGAEMRGRARDGVQNTLLNALAIKSLGK